MKVALLITTYNWPEALKLVLESVKLQTRLPDEVVIADDGSAIKTKELIQQYQANFPCPLIHAWQEDKGFRAAASRNNAIRAMSDDIEYVVMIDGDMLLHPKFIDDHLKFSEEGCFIQGSRSLIDKAKTYKLTHSKIPVVNLNAFSSGIKKRKNMLRFIWLSKLLASPINSLNGIRSCNMSFWLKDLREVNGFNESFIGWGREDSELVARLFNNGVLRINLRFSGLAYHLFHEENSREDLPCNQEKLDNAQEKNITWIENGLEY